jgi:hypothetical protein
VVFGLIHLYLHKLLKCTYSGGKIECQMTFCRLEVPLFYVFEGTYPRCSWGWRCFTRNLMYLHASFNKYQLVRHLALWVVKESLSNLVAKDMDVKG